MHLILGIEGSPELPNIFTVLHRYFKNTAWANFLYRWEDIIFSIIVATLISLIFYFGSKKKELIPSGFQNLLEAVVEGLRNFIVSVLGPEGEKFVPFLGTLFIYILTMNLIGMVPLFKSPSSNLNITAALAICVFVLVQYQNIKHMGIKGFLYHLAGSPKDAVGWIIAPLMFPIELLTKFQDQSPWLYVSLEIF